MKRIAFILSLTVCMVIVVIVFVYKGTAQEGNLKGTITTYADTSGVDGPLIIEIDEVRVYVGGGWVTVPSSVDSTIMLGDKVEAYVIKDENGNNSVLGCDECFIRKQ